MGIQSTVCAKLATEHAYVGRFNMKVSIKKDLVAVPTLFDLIGQCTDQPKAGLFKKRQTLGIGNAFAGPYFFDD